VVKDIAGGYRRPAWINVAGAILTAVLAICAAQIFFPQSHRSDAMAGCVADMTAGLPLERAAQIEQVMHLDDWRARP
jgi:hypothetical protein